MALSEFARSYNSFSGVDIKAVFMDVPIGTLQGISYSITREKAPIYTMGTAEPRSFSRGKRGIAGTLIFIVFDAHAVLTVMDKFAFMSDVEDLRPDINAVAQVGGATLSSPSNVTAATTAVQAELPITSVGDDQELARPWYADQIPPFDITLAAANEYGAMSVMRVLGVEILNEGSGVSIDDIVTEQQMTFIARSVLPWIAIDNPDFEKIGTDIS